MTSTTSTASIASAASTSSTAQTLGVAARLALVTLVITGIAYPLFMTAMARVLFPSASAGSLLKNEGGQVVGSKLIGQSFKSAGYLQGRPSAAGAGYDAASSGGSNLGPTSAKLRDRAKAEVARLRAENPDAPLPIPAELVSASASGLDPHLSPTAAAWQIQRIAQARNVSAERVRRLFDDHREGRSLGLWGEPKVNVLRVNMALDRHFGVLPPH